MAISYTILERKNYLSNNQNNHYFLKIVQNDVVNIDQLSKEIEKETSLSEVDVHAVLIALQGKIMKHLEEGNVVNLENLGKFSIAAKTIAHENKEDVSVKDVQKFGINFMPSLKIKRWLKKDFKLKKSDNK
ncbi:DNA-binding protein [Paenimyroides tangerinum]|uniref:DNA-binding protein n=1 Tax=Paenimyroides tangerinum TaxID=2488728 RepID=A0A3P3W5X4_9FLAO|nr:HU family DNA-binding protein [Paenimyroides tangerinum]RRJ88073.1 DNA-binding protein [Paenimyroides tangerinum]